MGAVEVSKLQSRKDQDLWNGLHAGNTAFYSDYLMSSISYLNTCVFNRELSECMCFVPVVERVLILEEEHRAIICENKMKRKICVIDRFMICVVLMV
jgi:hypothetical protein